MTTATLDKLIEYVQASGDTIPSIAVYEAMFDSRCGTYNGVFASYVNTHWQGLFEQYRDEGSFVRLLAGVFCDVEYGDPSAETYAVDLLGGEPEFIGELKGEISEYVYTGQQSYSQVLCAFRAYEGGLGLETMEAYVQMRSAEDVHRWVLEEPSAHMAWVESVLRETWGQGEAPTLDSLYRQAMSQHAEMVFDTVGDALRTAATLFIEHLDYISDPAPAPARVVGPDTCDKGIRDDEDRLWSDGPPTYTHLS